MSGVNRLRNRRFLSTAASVLGLLALVGCQTPAAGAQSSSSRNKAEVVRPVAKAADCTKWSDVSPANAANTLTICRPLLGSAAETDFSPDRFANLRLNIARAYLASATPNAGEARRLLEEAVNPRVLAPTMARINLTLADVYISSGTENDLNLALQKLGANSDIDSVRRRTDILALKGARERPNLEDLRSWQEASSLYYSLAIGSNPRRPTDVQRAEEQVGRSSQRLGEFYLAEAEKQAPFTRDSSAARDAAVASLREAARALATSQSADVRTRRGKALIQLAGYEGSGRAADFGCEPGRASPLGLSDARNTLTGINTPEAKALLGCVLRAQGNITDAVATLRDAASSAPAGSPASGDYYVMLGDAQRSRATSGSSTDPNRADAVASYESALRIYGGTPEPGTDADRAARRAKIAGVNFALGALKSLPGASTADLNAAQCHYVSAIQQDENFAAAYLEFGKHFYNLARTQGPNTRVSATCPGAAPVTGDYYNLALSYLSRADQKAAQTDNRFVRTEAQFFQSKALIEFGRSAGDLIRASDLSKAASDAAIGDWRYREQHCKSLIARGVAYLQLESRPYCANATIETPDGYALQGFYYLRRAQGYQRLTPEAVDELANAEASFQRGMNALDREGNNARPADERALLLAKLRIGRGTAKFCTAQRETGDQEIAQARRDDPRASDAALTEMDIYRVRSCDGSKVVQ